MVQAAVRVPRPLPAVEAGVASRTARDRTLALLAAALERRYPDMSVRRLGMDLLLTPIRRETTRCFLMERFLKRNKTWIRFLVLSA